MTNTSTSDAILQCRDCGSDYLLNAASRAWYEKRGLALPRRCDRCRAARRAQRAAEAAQSAASPASYDVIEAARGRE